MSGGDVRKGILSEGMFGGISEGECLGMNVWRNSSGECPRKRRGHGRPQDFFPEVGNEGFLRTDVPQ